MRSLVLISSALILSLAVDRSAAAQAPTNPPPSSVTSSAGNVTIERLATLEFPWGLAMLPDGRLLITEKPGRLRIWENGRLSEPVQGVPSVVYRGPPFEQGGLLDVEADPNFTANRLVYLSFVEAHPQGIRDAETGELRFGTFVDYGDSIVRGGAVARGRLEGNQLRDVQVIWRQVPKVTGPNHWGSRLVFRPDGTLFVTLGDRYHYLERAQDLSTTLGKIVRINADGSVPRDNPFVGREGVRPDIWSYGHRNIQAAALDARGQLWTVEHGARGGDELNNPQPGKNYGWPIITYGLDYSGARIGVGTAQPGMEQPVYYWDPVIAPSGATFYTGDAFPDWKGDLLVGSLRPGALVRPRLEAGRVVLEERYLAELGERIRDVRQAPDGTIYLLTDSSRGRVLRVEPPTR